MDQFVFEIVSSRPMRSTGQEGSKPISGRLVRSALGLGIALFLCAPVSAQVCDMTVGSDLACDHSTLSAALLAAALTNSAETICIARNHTETNVALSLVNWSNTGTGSGAGPLEIRGGWATCALTGTPTHTLLEGNGNEPVIEVEATSGRSSEVTLRSLKVAGGTNGIFAHDGATVYLKNVFAAENGRGIRVEYDSFVDVDFYSVVEQNSIPSGFGEASNGAGILCYQSTVHVAGIVRSNVNPLSSGGGLFANDCQIDLRDGAWFDANRAPSGAGLDVGVGTVVRGGGTGPWKVRITNNVATSSTGGGIYARTGADVLLGNVEITENSAAYSGAGIAVTGNGTKVQVERFNFEHCVDPPRCTLLNENRLTSGTNGSAGIATGGSKLVVMQAYVDGNSGAGDTGSLFQASGEFSTIELEGVQIWDNRAWVLLDADDQARITAGFVSAGRNAYLQGSPPLLDVVPARASSGATVGLYSSILADHVAFDDLTGTISAHCLYAETLSGLTPPTGASTTGASPGFRDLAGGDLRLTVSSPAVDFCDDSVYVPRDSDVDAEGRGFDVVSVPDLYGPWDLGFDEYRALFVDGFESGNTSRWSSTTP